jgi:hypothetical protein
LSWTRPTGPTSPPEEYAAAEVRWDGLMVADELDVALPFLARVATDQAGAGPTVQE